MLHAPVFRTATPRVVRVELTELYAGRGAAAVQLDGVPCDRWTDAMRDVLSTHPDFARVRAQVEGSWIYFMGFCSPHEATAARLVALVRAVCEQANAPAPRGLPLRERGESVPQPEPSARA